MQYWTIRAFPINNEPVHLFDFDRGFASYTIHGAIYTGNALLWRSFVKIGFSREYFIIS